MGSEMCIRDSSESGPTYPKGFAARGVPKDGLYRISVKATAVGRNHPYAPELIPADLTQPLQMGLWHVPGPSYLAKRTSEGRVLVEVFDLADNKPQTYEATVWMPAGSVRSSIGLTVLVPQRGHCKR